MLCGLPERFASEMTKIVPEKVKLNIIAANNDRKLTAWQGASIVSALTSFYRVWIQKKEWVEKGERVLLEKSF